MRNFTAIVIFIILSSCDAGTRRRRRNMYNDRPCGAGQHAILSKSKRTVMSCEACPKNTYRPDTKHAMEACLKCEAGRVSSEDFTHCTGDICRAGTYGTSDSIICTPCEIGKYSVDGKFSCNDCESGRYNNAIGQDSCDGENCPGGKYGPVGQSEKQHAFCTKCPEGKWSLEGISQCDVCISGKYSRENADTCISHEKCPRDKFYSALPSTTSSKISCKKCIYYSDVYFAGFVFSCVVFGMNIILYLYDRKKYYYILLVNIPTVVLILTLTFCIGKPKDNLAIISIVINIFCICPVVNAMITLCKKYYNVYCETRKKPSTKVVKNSMGRDMIIV